MQEKTSKYIEDFLNFIRLLQQEYDYSVAREQEQNDLTQDILHCLELEELSYHRQAKLGRYLKEVRRERRRYKDRIEELEAVAAFAKANRKFLNELEQILGAVRKQEKYHADRNYHPRVLKKEELEKVLEGQKM